MSSEASIGSLVRQPGSSDARGSHRLPAAAWWTARSAWRQPKPQRRTELGLLTVVLVIVVFAYTLSSLGTTSKIPTNLGWFLAFMVCLVLLAHLANRWLAPYSNPIMLPLVAFLNGLGYVLIAGLDPHEARLQAVWSAVGVLFYIATLWLFRRVRELDRYRYLMLFGGLALLLLPLVPHFGLNINGARLWIKVGPITFQPVEAAKVVLCIFFASYFAEKRAVLKLATVRVGNHLLADLRALGPLLLAWGFSMLVMLTERNVGFSLMIFVLFVAMLWVATGKTSYLLLAAILFSIGAFVGAHLFWQVNERVVIWLDPWKYAETWGYQIIQGQYALGSGGLAGSGLGLGHPQLIPVVTSDFIFAALGEELGLLGTSAVVMAFLLLVAAGIRTAISATTDFAKLLAVGLTTVLGVQSFFIMAGVVRLLPLTGVTLPFVSYGGSALVANYVLIAVLMRISNETAFSLPKEGTS